MRVFGVCMIKLDEPFKLDRNKIWYIDSKDVSTKPVFFNEFREAYTKKREFLEIEGVDNYIIKDIKMRKYLFNELRTLHSLSNYIKVQDELPNIGFPIGYYKDNNKVLGTIIPYYKDSISLQKAAYLHAFSELQDYYNNSENKIRNLIMLFLDILDIINSMYEKNVSYLDVHSGNFLLYKNSIKVIDFELNYVHFKNRQKYLQDICRNYIFLVRAILRNYGFENINLSPSENLYETREDIIKLEKRLYK